MIGKKTLKKDTSQASIGDWLQNTNTKNEMNQPSTNNDKSQESLKDTGASSSDQNDKEYHVGDIVWAKIGRYPYWPCIVCNDPDTNTYMLGSPKDKKKFSLHVRFCNDNGRRNWVKNLHNFSGKDDLLSNYPNGLSYIKNNKKQTNIWNMAVNEAENWLQFDREERWIKFSEKYRVKSPPNTPLKELKYNSSSSATSSKKLPKCDPSTSATPQIKLPECNPSTSETASETNLGFTFPITMESVLEQRKKMKKPPQKKKKVVIDMSFKVPEENYHIDDHPSECSIPRHPHKRVLERLRLDIEKMEEEGIRKVKEWQASKLAKAAKASTTPAN